MELIYKVTFIGFAGRNWKAEYRSQLEMSVAIASWVSDPGYSVCVVSERAR